MNLLPVEMRNVQNEQRQEKIELIHKYQDKLNFSAISLIFFVAIAIYTYLVPTLGFLVPILSTFIALVFTQQTIRSYNYREFHKNNYKFMESAYEIVEESLKLKD